MLYNLTMREKKRFLSDCVLGKRKIDFENGAADDDYSSKNYKNFKTLKL